MTDTRPILLIKPDGTKELVDGSGAAAPYVLGGVCVETGKLATPADAVRHNARILLPLVRGKSKAERLSVYEGISLGPLLSPIKVLLGMVRETP